MAFFSTHSRGRQILTSLKAARPIALLVSEFYRFYWDKKHIFLAETDKLFGVFILFYNCNRRRTAFYIYFSRGAIRLPGSCLGTKTREARRLKRRSDPEPYHPGRFR